VGEVRGDPKAIEHSGDMLRAMAQRHGRQALDLEALALPD
jgi:hypothetical protein